MLSIAGDHKEEVNSGVNQQCVDISGAFDPDSLQVSQADAGDIVPWTGHS